MQQRDDGELVVRAVHGDEAAFAALFDRHGAAVFRYAWAVTEHPDDVDDVVQETFLVAWRRRRALPQQGSTLPWLLVTCRNVALNHNRRRRRHPVAELPASLAAPGDDRRAAAEQLSRVSEALAALPALERRLCELCLIEGRPYAEAAAELGITAAAARKRVQRVRARLRAERDRDEEG